MKLHDLFSDKTVEYDYEADGFIFVRGFFSKATIGLVEDFFVYSAERELMRLGISMADVPPPGYILPGHRALWVLAELEKRDRNAFYKLCSKFWTPSYPAALVSASKPLVEFYARLYDLPASLVYTSEGALFFNHPSVTRLQYDWHTEKHYFSASPTFRIVNLWFPIFVAASERNGTMVLARGSHKFEHQSTRIPAPQSVTQMKVEESALEPFEKVHCTLDRGDLCLFDVNLVHRTGANQTQVPRTSIAMRFCDFETKASDDGFHTGAQGK